LFRGGADTTRSNAWFREHERDVHGINLEDSFPPPEQILDFRVQAEAVG
jgi:hypothetical protein